MNDSMASVKGLIGVPGIGILALLDLLTLQPVESRRFVGGGSPRSSMNCRLRERGRQRRASCRPARENNAQSRTTRPAALTTSPTLRSFRGDFMTAAPQPVSAEPTSSRIKQHQRRQRQPVVPTRRLAAANAEFASRHLAFNSSVSEACCATLPTRSVCRANRRRVAPKAARFRFGCFNSSEASPPQAISPPPATLDRPRTSGDILRSFSA